MLSGYLQRAFAHDLNFRLALNRAAKATPPLNTWVIRNIVSDRNLAILLFDVLQNIGEHPSEIEAIYDPKFTGLRKKIFLKLSRDPRVALMVAEWMEKSNERMQVLAGLKSRLEGLWQYLGRSKTSPTA